MEFALDAAFQAGRSTLALFQTGPKVDTKVDRSPVTQADLDAETILRTAIEAAFPGEAILGEEQGLSGEGSSRWIIDPIDGTKSFIAGVPLYATLLSFEIDEIPQLGVCYFPALDEMLYAERGTGAFFNGRPCFVSAEQSLSHSVICIGSLCSLDRHGKLAGALRLSGQALATRSWSDAYGHALVATGRAAAMIDPVVSRWDLSAMSIIVEEAGGVFSDFSGRKGIFEEAVSASAALHATILEAFRP